MKRARPFCIISGGQTGADQGGLEAAVILGIETGGCATAGWRTEDGPAPWLADLGLCEHKSRDYPPRTRANVNAADGTVWFGADDSAGFACTFAACMSLERPLSRNPDAAALERFCWGYSIETLNVAGNRESTNPGIGAHTRDTLIAAFSQ